MGNYYSNEAKGASLAETQMGSAATGKFNLRVAMPDHVWCQQMFNGMYPGNKFLQFTPTGVATLVAEKRAKHLYAALKVDIDVEAGGQEPTGWSFKKIHDVVKRHELDFAAKGIRLTFCIASYWDFNQESGRREVEYRCWLEFGDMSKLARMISDRAHESKAKYDPITSGESSEVMSTNLCALVTIS